MYVSRHIVLILIFSLFACKTPTQKTKMNVTISEQDVKNYESFLTRIKACLTNAESPRCLDNIKAHRMLPISLLNDSQTALLKNSFEDGPRNGNFSCQSITSEQKACRVAIYRKLPARNGSFNPVTVIVSTKNTELNALRFSSMMLMIKLRLISNSQGDIVKLCEVSGVEARDRITNFFYEILAGEFRYHRDGRLDSVEMYLGGLTLFNGKSDDCNF